MGRNKINFSLKKKKGEIKTWWGEREREKPMSLLRCFSTLRGEGGREE